MRQKINKLLFKLALPLFLILLGALSFFNYLKLSEFGPLTLEINEKLGKFSSYQTNELLKGDKISGEFHYKFNNLGIFSMRFNNQNRDSKDTIVFRLKEAGHDKWYYQANYETDQFLPHKHFPFGFPVISESANKTYQFEIESLRGATGSGILMDVKSPIFVAKSTFTKASLLQDKKLLIYFLVNKFTNVFGSPDTSINLFLFFLPLIFYFAYVITSKINYPLLVSVVVMFVLWDIFYLKESYDFLYLSIFFLWSLISLRFKFESRIAASIALICLFFVPVALISNQDSIAERVAIWAYLFLCITVAQQIYEIKHKTSKLLHLKDFYLNFTVQNLVKGFGLESNIYAKSFILITIPAVMVYLTFKKIIDIYFQYKIYFPVNYPQQFVKGTYIAIILAMLCVLMIYLLLLKQKQIWVKIVSLSILSYFIFGFFLSSTTPFVSVAKIFSISPGSTSEAWTDVTIRGVNFRDLPFVGKVLIDGVEQGVYVVEWSDKKVVFRTSPEITKTGMLQVAPKDKKVSNKVPFVYNFKY